MVQIQIKNRGKVLQDVWSNQQANIILKMIFLDFCIRLDTNKNH